MDGGYGDPAPLARRPSAVGRRPPSSASPERRVVGVALGARRVEQVRLRLVLRVLAGPPLDQVGDLGPTAPGLRSLGPWSLPTC